MLYQLSYIGPQTPLSAIAFNSQQPDSLHTVVSPVRLSRIVPVQPGLHREQCQNRKRRHANPLVRNCRVRQQSENDERRKCNRQPTHWIPRKLTLGISAETHALKSWCTGKDSNLRTSLGGTDLQSVGFNHSPTCAETAQASAPNRERSRPDSPLRGCTNAEWPCRLRNSENQEWSAHTRARKITTLRKNS